MFDITGLLLSVNFQMSWHCDLQEKPNSNTVVGQKVLMLLFQSASFFWFTEC